VKSSEKLINIGSRQLQTFLEITQLQSFAKAAERVHLSASGVSMLVKDLEAQVGARLFERTTRTVKLTDAGQRLVPVAQRIVNELRELGTAVQGAEAAVRSRLLVAATPIVATSLLPGVVSEFVRSHPQVRVHLTDGDVGVVRRAVLEDESDVGLGFFVKPSAGLKREPLCQFRLMRISPPGTGRAGLGPSRPWSSLAGLPLVSLPPDNPVQMVIERHLTGPRRGHEERSVMNFLGTLIAMVEAGLGHAVVPSFVLDECLRHGLSVAMLVEPAVHLDLYLVSRRGITPKPAAVDFAAAVKRAAARFTT
jgi:LysR family carnitine catabolism transcriptional activator